MERGFNPTPDQEMKPSNQVVPGRPSPVPVTTGRGLEGMAKPYTDAPKGIAAGDLAAAVKPRMGPVVSQVQTVDSRTFHMPSLDQVKRIALGAVLAAGPLTARTPEPGEGPEVEASRQAMIRLQRHEAAMEAVYGKRPPAHVPSDGFSKVATSAFLVAAAGMVIKAIREEQKANAEKNRQLAPEKEVGHA